MKLELLSILAIIGLCCHLVIADDHWIWSNRNRRDRSYRDDRAITNDKFRSEQLYVLNERQRDREPTTKRPIPGIPQNEDIDDYVDTDDKNVVGTRNYYAPNGFYGGQLGGGSGGGGGFNQFPGSVGGFGGNGILVGPGGPTGIIGRPQHYFPGAGGFPGAHGFGGQAPASGGGGNLNYPIQPGVGAGVGSIYPNNGFGQAQGGQYPGSFYTPNGQYPVQGNHQFGNSQYPVIGQYPGNGPIYTEGYGLANLNGGYPSTGIGYPQNPYGSGFNGFGAGGYNDYDQKNRKLQVEEDKKVAEESRKISDRTIDDKVNKNLQKKRVSSPAT